MKETITATFASADALKNVVDDLLGAGIPQEKFFADKSNNQIKVITPGASAPGIMEILKKHNPTNVSERNWT